MQTVWAGGESMKAAVREEYGRADRVHVRDVPMPEVTRSGVLVRVRAAALNRIDWYSLSGEILIARQQMGMRRPTSPRLGLDFAGTVEAVGEDVSDLSVGDDVFGIADGALAEYVVAEKVAPKPDRLSFEDAAASPLAGVTALQALRDKARLAPGQRVLVNGASGGVGTFTVQVAKALGAAHVTAVCSARHADLAREIGADAVVDYADGELAAPSRDSDLYHVAVQVNGSQSWAAYRRVLRPGGVLVLVGGPANSRVLGPLRNVARLVLASRLGSRRALFFIAATNRDDLRVLRTLLEHGDVKPAIDRQFSLDEVAAAFEYFGQGHAGGKVVVTI